jgi:hypothetical protein
MPQLKLDIPHALDPDEAARRLKQKSAAMLAEHKDRLTGFREEWLDHTGSFAFRALGMDVSATVAVEPQRIRLAASLPLAAMIFKSVIEQRIRQEVGSLLA